MELIKDVMRQFYPLLIMCACVSFVVYVFFSVNNNGEKGVFEHTGNIYESMMEEEELKHDGLYYLVDEVDPYVPEIIYNAGAKQVGDCVGFRELFLVKKDSSWVIGEDDDFTLYLTDIKSNSGNSVLERMSSEEIADMEEIPATFVYDKDQDMLHIFGSGVYTVQIKVYGNNGATRQYEFNLPVESL